MKKPLLKDLYYEAYNLRNQIYDLLKPDIVMLNSNPLIKKSENVYFPNNQYYILSELKNIESNIRIKSNILNKENLKKALNGQGEILIIQSDPYEEGYITLESKKGESINEKDSQFVISGLRIGSNSCRLRRIKLRRRFHYGSSDPGGSDPGCGAGSSGGQRQGSSHQAGRYLWRGYDRVQVDAYV